jgi:hypothetical protein
VARPVSGAPGAIKAVHRRKKTVERRVRQRVLMAWAAHSPDLPAILGVQWRPAGLEPQRQTPVPLPHRSSHGHSCSDWITRMMWALVVGRQAVTGALS